MPKEVIPPEKYEMALAAAKEAKANVDKVRDELSDAMGNDVKIKEGLYKMEKAQKKLKEEEAKLAELSVPTVGELERQHAAARDAAKTHAEIYDSYEGGKKKSHKKRKSHKRDRTRKHRKPKSHKKRKSRSRRKRKSRMGRSPHKTRR